jgi:AraC-like DNA-binding protein
MFNSNQSAQDVAVRNPSGDVLTVVDTSMQRQLNLVLGEAARPIHLDSVSTAISIARKVPVRAVLLGPASIGPEASPAVATLASICAGGVLIAVIGGWTPALAERLLAFGSSGIRDAVDLSRREGLNRLRTLLTREEWDLANRIAQTILPSLEPATAEMRFFISHLIRTAPFVSSIKVVASDLRVCNSSMSSRFFRAGLPSPKKYLAATRLIYAAGVLEIPGVSAVQAARRLHYSSPQSFGRHVREQLGVSASEFREKYSFEVMADHFANRLLLRHRDTLRWFEPLRRRVSTGQKPINKSE